MHRRTDRHGTLAILPLVAVQGLCALYFVGNILLSLLGIAVRPIPWALHEALEIGAAIGLSVGFLIGTATLWRSLRERRRAEEDLRRARSLFRDQMAERFEHWGLTPAEADVAIFAIKGLRLQEIAELRRTSEGTVKAQANAIYRKAGVNGRSQLLSLFTPAEADVAIFAIKGLRLQEIAELRRTSEGTVKAQANAIYRKAGVNGRSQLLSLFIEDLMVEAEAEDGSAAEPLRRAA